MTTRKLTPEVVKYWKEKLEAEKRWQYAAYTNAHLDALHDLDLADQEIAKLREAAKRSLASRDAGLTMEDYELLQLIKRECGDE